MIYPNLIMVVIHFVNNKSVLFGESIILAWLGAFLHFYFTARDLEGGFDL